MGIFSKLFSQENDKPEIKVTITSSVEETPQKKHGVFSDNDASLMDDITSNEQVSPTHKLPFSSSCPYCGVVYDKPIKRKKTCRECHKTIHVRTTQDLFPNSALTDEQLNHADLYLSLKNTIYITMDDYKNTERMLMRKWNMDKINTYDVLWSIFNSLALFQRHIDKEYDKQQVITEVLRRKQWTGIAAAEYQGRRGHDPSGYLQSANNYAIQAAKLDQYAKGLTVRCYSCCDACMKFNDKTFSIDFLRKTPVLPIKTCTRPLSDASKFTFCTCSYDTYYEWD